jgi:hypothetical protein
MNVVFAPENSQLDQVKSLDLSRTPWNFVETSLFLLYRAGFEGTSFAQRWKYIYTLECHLFFRHHLCWSLLFLSFYVYSSAEQHYIPLPSAFTFIMIATFSLLLSSVALSFASPLGDLAARTVTALNTAAFEEAQQRDDTATRAFSSTEIKVCMLPGLK